MKPPEQVGSASRLTAFAVLCGLTWVLGVLAWSTLILALVESLLLIAAVSYLVSRYVLRRLVCRRVLPSVANEDQRIVVELELENPSRLPAFLIEVRDQLSADPNPGKQVLLAGLSRSSGKQTVRYHGICGRGRGVYKADDLQLAISDPMGLFRLRRKVDCADEIVVHPGGLDLSLADLPTRCMTFEISGAETPRPGQSISPRGIRECREAAPLRHIHWRASARTGELMIKEFEAGTGLELSIFLDLDKSTRRGTGRFSNVEQAIRVAATLGRYAAREEHRIGLLADDGQPVVLPSRSGRKQLTPLLDLLARVEVNGSTGYLDLLERGYPLINRGATLILILNSPDIDTDRLLALCGTWRRRQVAVRSYLMADGEIQTAQTQDALARMGVPTTVVDCAQGVGR